MEGDTVQRTKLKKIREADGEFPCGMPLICPKLSRLAIADRDDGRCLE
jgi:hypothetical protein